MKKIRFLCAILAIVLLAGCSSASQVKERVITENMPTVLKIFSPLAFQTAEKNTDQAAVDAWNVMMSDTYGTQILLTTEVDISILGGSAVNAVQQGKLNGMVELAAGEIVSLMGTETGTNDMPSYIVPLDEYLASNKVWTSLPLEFRNRFEKDGHIWAIPKSLGNSLEVTSINTAWLAKIGKGIPDSADSLYEAGQLFISNDANGDSIKNDYLLSAFNSFDNNIYTSFGVYQNGYNPADNYFSDPAAGKGMPSLFKFYKNMYNAGMLDLDSFFTPGISAASQANYATIQTSVGAGKYGAGFTLEVLNGKTEEQLLEEYEKTAALYEAIPPFSSVNPVTYTDDGACFVLIKGSDEPGETVNAFVDILFGSVQSNLDCTLGVSENYAIGGNKVVTCKYADIEAETLPLYPNLTDTLDLTDSGWIIIKPGQNAELVRRLKEDGDAYEEQYIEKYTAEGKLLKLPVWYISSYYASRMMNLRGMLYYSEFPRYQARNYWYFDQLNSFNKLTAPVTSSQAQ